MDHHAIEAYMTSGTGLLLQARPAPVRLSGLLEDERLFDKCIHEREIHAPIPVFTHPADGYYHRCLDMPVRMPGQIEYSLPNEWAGLAELVQQVIDTEHAHNRNWIDYYTYLSIDSSPVRAGQVQRNPGLHTDGFQGVRQPQRTKGSRGYVLTSNGGTAYYPQTFKVGWDEAVYNIFEGFDLQAGPALLTKANTVNFMSCYAVHSAGAADHDGNRLFFRLVWEMKRFDRANNTHNAMLDYDWPPLLNDVRDRLRTPTWDDLA